MDHVIPVVATMALLGSALVGGIFFALSSFIMKAPAGVPTAAGPGAREVWEHYLDRWTMWNHIRTATAMVVAVLYTVGLLHNGST
jgi:uncharacterized membrane protein